MLLPGRGLPGAAGALRHHEGAPQRLRFAERKGAGAAVPAVYHRPCMGDHKGQRGAVQKRADAGTGTAGPDRWQHLRRDLPQAVRVEPPGHRAALAGVSAGAAGAGYRQGKRRRGGVCPPHGV